MAKPSFSGERVIDTKRGIRSYVDPKAFQTTPAVERAPFRIPKWAQIGIGVGITGGCIIWLFIGSSLFTITSVEIRGEAKQETTDAVNKLVGKNIFLIGGKKAEQSLAEQQPGIKEIQVIRGLPHSVIVALVERDPAIVWESGGIRYLVDTQGIAFKQAEGAYPRVVDEKNLPVKLGSVVSDPLFIAYVQSVNKDLFAQTTYENDYMSIPETTFQVNIHTKQSIVLKLDTSRILADQLSDIRYILDHNKDTIKQSIDVRVPGFAYIL